MTEHPTGLAVGVAAYKVGCRCDGCCGAQRAYWQVWYAANRERFLERQRERRRSPTPEKRREAEATSVPEGHPVGRKVGVAAYRRGCRCDGCREAKRAYGRAWETSTPGLVDRRREQRRESARRYEPSPAAAAARREWEEARRARDRAARVAQAEKRLAFYDEHDFFGEVS